MLLRFTKMHGLGNDFVLLDLISQNITIRDEQIKLLADRRLGVGFDQLLTVEPPDNPEADFKYRIFNADGSEAEQCGNGARCLLRFVRDRGLTTKTKIKLETNTGVIECELEKDGNISVDMGRPVLQPKCIPFIADQAQILYKLNVSLPLCGSEESVNIASLNIGNPHAVIVVEDVDESPVAQLGAAIEKHRRFPDRVNVGFMQIIARDHIRLRVFERGVGETLACGTGACAAVVAGRLQGLLDETVEVSLPGGNLRITWQGDDSPVKMTGPACRVYEGRLHI
ncbi:MAG TPA: diaminopimelate epimerase [Pseudomonadales bacterium]|jgi:diaminopimelate epimerase|nr:diaminopimelate epimerase [Pseudomonadales bacterium]MDP6315034.1 diaminopimelate epimerase [Pseudomonadales bacterium]MDP7315839.1 diaminopimelate epimerase [Pseudomonadales bacterium]MDP7575655.1 diaminopimelate epimerase [Pseudomonadales bacterium]HJL61997.1 diaminopimelate epimerase [Pseudomonadales bacterium]|tara:strand:+ start:456 stop:1304 length:849 start_codon:yes stop_codon:yes gene_type:complete